MNVHVGLRAVGLILTIPMASLAVDEHRRTPEALKTDCRLDVVKKSCSAPEEFVGILLLKNTSTETLKIEYDNHPLEYLDLDVKDENGATLPKSLASYGFLYSPIGGGPRVLTIPPGETYRWEVVLFAQVDKKTHPVTPGQYTVVALYRWAADRRSNTVTIEVTAK
jgi:hypothetical protein